MTTINTQDWFFSAPRNYLEDERLDIYDKMVYTVLCSYANAASKTAFPSAKTIAKEGGLGRTKVFECIKKLEQFGYITRKQRFKVTVEKNTNKKKISNDTNEYTLVAPSSRGELVHGANHLPSSPGELVHEANYPPSSPGEHRTDFDFDFDLIDDDKKLVLNICYQVFEDLKPEYEKLNIEIVFAAMNRSLAKNPNDLFKYVKKAVIADLTNPIISKKSLNIKPKKKPATKKPIRTEMLPDWFDKQPEGQNHDNAELEAKKRAIEEKLKVFRKKA